MPRRRKTNSPPASPSQKSRPKRKYSADDEAAYRQAYAGVSRLAGKPLVAPIPRAPTPVGRPAAGGQSSAGAAALVRPHFRIIRDEGWFEAHREGDATAVRNLRRRQPEAEIDLHGCRVEEAQQRVVEFVRRSHHAGKRVIRIIHGKGLHSPRGEGVLGEAVLSALTEGTTASWVLAVVTCSPRYGGSGALLVQLGAS